MELLEKTDLPSRNYYTEVNMDTVYKSETLQV